MQLYILIMAMFFNTFQHSEKRVLNIYTKDLNNSSYKQQLNLLQADKAGLAERDLIVTTYTLSQKTAALFKAKKIKAGFTVILTGKDGGEKFRSTKPTQPKQLYSLIDSMPMRKDELRKKEKM